VGTVRRPRHSPVRRRTRLTLAFSSAPIRESVRRCHEVTDEVLIKILIFLPSADGATLFSLFERENDVLFLCLKEKERKRSKQTCRLIACACGSGIPKARRPAYANSLREVASTNLFHKFVKIRTFLHDSARSRRVLGLRFFGSLHRMEALPDGGRASSRLHRPQEPISFPPIADEKSYIRAQTVVNDIKRLALRESSRRSRVRGFSADQP